MNDTSKDKFSFIIYQDKNVPKFMQINATSMRMIFYGMPIITLLSLFATSAVFYYMEYLKTSVVKEEPSIINQLRQSNTVLQQELLENKELVKEFQEKQNATVGNSIAALGLFKSSANTRDISVTAPWFTIDQLSAFSDQKNLHVRFNIVNINQNEKRAGHVWVFVRHADELQAYPAQNSGQEEFLFQYFDGEPFSTSRFRPVDATFRLPQKATDNILIKILIFSRSGDLIFEQVTNKTLGI